MYWTSWMPDRTSGELPGRLYYFLGILITWSSSWIGPDGILSPLLIIYLIFSWRCLSIILFYRPCIGSSPGATPAYIFIAALSDGTILAMGCYLGCLVSMLLWLGEVKMFACTLGFLWYGFRSLTFESLSLWFNTGSFSFSSTISSRSSALSFFILGAFFSPPSSEEKSSYWLSGNLLEINLRLLGNLMVPNMSILFSSS